MLISVNDASKRLKITPRMVQIKAKQFNVPKVGNVYQLTEEVVSNWEVSNPETKITPNRTLRSASPPKRNNTFSLSSFIIALLILMVSAVIVVFYINLDSQIVEAKSTIKENTIEHKVEVKQLTKKLNDAHDVIQQQELEIQTLKFKDSLRTFKKW